MPKLKYEFTMFFDQFYDHYYKISSCKARNVLMHLIRVATYKRNLYSLNKGNRIDICLSLGIDKYQLSKALKCLREAGFIEEINENVYLNPLFVWKGDSRIRDKVLKIKSDALYNNGEEISFGKILASSEYFI